MMEVLAGFLIAATVGLTGIGGGSFTTPVLVLFFGLPAAESVGTAMIFAAALRLLAAPFYIVRRHVHARYLILLLAGAIPGLLLGTWLLHFFYVESWKSTVLVIVGVLLTTSSAITFLPRLRNPDFSSRRSRWLSALALPIGIETGFSSAGAGALGTVLMLNFSEMSVPQVVGTDIVFGIVLAFIGGAFHILWGSINHAALVNLMIGGIPGVLVGGAFSGRVPAHKLRTAIALIAMVLGVQLVYSGARDLVQSRRHSVANLDSRSLHAGGEWR